MAEYNCPLPPKLAFFSCPNCAIKLKASYPVGSTHLTTACPCGTRIGVTLHSHLAHLPLAEPAPPKREEPAPPKRKEAAPLQLPDSSDAGATLDEARSPRSLARAADGTQRATRPMTCALRPLVPPFAVASAASR